MDLDLYNRFGDGDNEMDQDNDVGILSDGDSFSSEPVHDDPSVASWYDGGPASAAVPAVPVGPGSGSGSGSVGVSGPGGLGLGSRPRVQLPASCGPPPVSRGMTSSTRRLVWIVFGGTGHIGRSVVKSALAHGDFVTTVGRTFETTPAAMAAMAAAAEQAGRDEGGWVPEAETQKMQKTQRTCLGTLCDVRSRASVEGAVQRALACFGRIDVVANCSGYGVVGACEDQDEHELRNQFETNFMGTLHIVQATLPVLRRQYEEAKRRGTRDTRGTRGGRKETAAPEEPAPSARYLIFSSTSGALGVPGLGPYCATKYAVEGLIEAMQYEVDPFGIKATLVEPGYVRRDDPQTAGRPASARPASAATTSAATTSTSACLPTWGHFLIQPPSEPYAAASAPARHATRLVQWLGDRQPTSVVQCAELVWQLAHCAFPPLRLPLGSYAIESIRDRLRSITEELEDWKHLHFPLPPDAAGGAAKEQATSAGPPEKAAQTAVDRQEHVTDE